MYRYLYTYNYEPDKNLIFPTVLILFIILQQMILENLNAEKLPSYAFYTPIDILSITNCTFGTIERKAFPINEIGNATLTNVTVDRVEGEAFQNSTLISNLRMTRCVIREMQSHAIMSVVQSIVIEQSK